MKVNSVHSYNRLTDTPRSFGWWADLICRIHRDYNQYTLDELMYEIPLMRLFVLYSWSFYNEPVHQFSGVQMVNSYAELESVTLLKQLKDFIAKQKAV